MGWVDEQWTDAKLTLSQRKTWEIVTALCLILLAILSVVFCFIFTIVAPPGQNDDSATAISTSQDFGRQQQQHSIPMFFKKRSVNYLPTLAADQGMLVATAAELNVAQRCAEIASENLGKATVSEAVDEAFSCVGHVADPEQGTIAHFKKGLAVAFESGNLDAATSILVKLNHQEHM